MGARVEVEPQKVNKTPRPWLSLSKVEECTAIVAISFDMKENYRHQNGDSGAAHLSMEEEKQGCAAQRVSLKQVQVKCNGVLQRQKHCDGNYEVSVDNLERGKEYLVEARVRSGILDWSAWSPPLMLMPVPERDLNDDRERFTWEQQATHQIEPKGAQGEMGKEENGGVMRSIDVRESHMKQARRSEEGGASLCKACAAAAVRAQSEEAGAQTEENEAQTSLSFNPTAIITFLTRMTSPQTKNAIHPGFLEEVPAEFVCPITMEIMEDPVIATDGHAYEKEAIESWFEKSDRSPKTNEPLASTLLVRSHTLRAIINDYMEAHPYAEPVVLL